MPNYCFNRIKLNITQEEVERIKERVFSKDEFGDEYFDCAKRFIVKSYNTLVA